MKEYDFIKTLLKKRRRSKAQINDVFEADAEIIDINGVHWGGTVDEFSEKEDFFFHHDPRVIGWNLAVATLSDLFACGIKPEFFMQSLVRTGTKNEIFYEKLMDGVYSVLDECACFLLGGDTGYDENWRYSGIALGKADNKAVTRVIRKQCDFDIWISGCCGDSNLAILKNLDIPLFELRFDTVDLIGKYALAATDSSGGFCDAIWNLKRLNPGFDFKINLDVLPFAPGVLETAQEKGLPVELTLIGGAGEYELLILAPKEYAEKFRKNPAMSRIGSGSPVDAQGAVRFFRDNVLTGEMQEEPPCYRSSKKEEYLQITMDYFNNNFSRISRE